MDNSNYYSHCCSSDADASISSCIWTVCTYLHIWFSIDTVVCLMLPTLPHLHHSSFPVIMHFVLQHNLCQLDPIDKVNDVIGLFTLHPNSVLNAHCSISHITWSSANRIECALRPNRIRMCIESNWRACHVTPRPYELGK